MGNSKNNLNCAYAVKDVRLWTIESNSSRLWTIESNSSN